MPPSAVRGPNTQDVQGRGVPHKSDGPRTGDAEGVGLRPRAGDLRPSQADRVRPSLVCHSPQALWGLGDPSPHCGGRSPYSVHPLACRPHPQTPSPTSRDHVTKYLLPPTPGLGGPAKLTRAINLSGHQGDLQGSAGSSWPLEAPLLTPLSSHAVHWAGEADRGPCCQLLSCPADGAGVSVPWERDVTSRSAGHPAWGSWRSWACVYG